MLPHPVDVGEPQVGSTEIRGGSTRNETPQGAMAAISLHTLFVPVKRGNPTRQLPLHATIFLPCSLGACYTYSFILGSANKININLCISDKHLARFRSPFQQPFILRHLFHPTRVMGTTRHSSSSFAFYHKSNAAQHAWKDLRRGHKTPG